MNTAFAHPLHASFVLHAARCLPKVRSVEISDEKNARTRTSAKNSVHALPIVELCRARDFSEVDRSFFSLARLATNCLMSVFSFPKESFALVTRRGILGGESALAMTERQQRIVDLLRSIYISFHRDTYVYLSHPSDGNKRLALSDQIEQCECFI